LDANKPEFPCVSVIIVNYNGMNVLRDCLNSLIETIYPNFEIVVVDNGSIDGSVNFLGDFRKQSKIPITVIKNDCNLGFAQANNIGVAYSSCKYVALLNNDTVVDKNWLSNLVDNIEQNDSVGAVQSLLLKRNGLGIDSLGGLVDIFGTAEDRVSHSYAVQKNANSEDEQIFSACAAAVIFRRKVFEKVGKFDSLFFAYYEDVDLSWRIRLHGYSVILERKSVVYHMRSQTSKRFRPQIFEYHLYKNQLAMLIKNYGTKAFLKVTPVVGLLYFYRIINALKRNDGYLALATLKAVSWDIKNLQYLLLQRRYVQRFVRRVDDREIEKMMSKMPLQLLRKNL
jgi:GT2 family glycosyltransferase